MDDDRVRCPPTRIVVDRYLVGRGIISHGDRRNDGRCGSGSPPPEIRDRLDLESGDRIRWRVGAGGELSAEVVEERYGARDDVESIDIGEETNAVEVESEFGGH